jgi:hypothetical protein
MNITNTLRPELKLWVCSASSFLEPSIKNHRHPLCGMSDWLGSNCYSVQTYHSNIVVHIPYESEFIFVWVDHKGIIHRDNAFRKVITNSSFIKQDQPRYARSRLIDNSHVQDILEQSIQVPRIPKGDTVLAERARSTAINLCKIQFQSTCANHFGSFVSVDGVEGDLAPIGVILKR